MDSRSWRLSVAAVAHASDVAAAQGQADKKRRRKANNVSTNSNSGKHGASSSKTDSQKASQKAAPGSVEVEVVVLGARELPAADVFGSSDPYAVATWQRKKVRARVCA